MLDTIESAIDDIRQGKLVIVVDDEDRENEGDLILAACHATPENIGFMVRHTSGVLCVAMAAEALAEFLADKTPEHVDQAAGRRMNQEPDRP